MLLVQQQQQQQQQQPQVSQGPPAPAPASAMPPPPPLSIPVQPQPPLSLLSLRPPASSSGSPGSGGLASGPGQLLAGSAGRRPAWRRVAAPPMGGSGSGGSAPGPEAPLTTVGQLASSLQADAALPAMAQPEPQAAQEGEMATAVAANGEQAEAEVECCSHCSATRTSGKWRRHPTSSQRLCNACGDYASRHGGQLLEESVLQRRPAEPQRRGSKEEIAQRRCLQCGSASPGGGTRATWLRHPLTGQEWLCKPCYNSAQLRKKRRQQQDGGSSSGGEEEEEQARVQEAQQEAGALPTSLDGPAAAAKKRPRMKRQPMPASNENDSGTQRGQGQQEQHQASEPTAQQRRCQLCGSASPGSDSQHWRRHPLTGQEWVCSPCQGRVYRQLKREQAQQGIGSSGGEKEQQAAPAQDQHAGAARATPAAAAAGAKRRREQMQQPSDRHPEQPALPAPPGVPPAAHAPSGAPAGVASGQLAAGPAAEIEQQLDVLSLLEAATEQAAAAAAGLTPELAAAFAMQPPLEDRKVGAGWGSGCVGVRGE